MGRGFSLFQPTKRSGEHRKLRLGKIWSHFTCKIKFLTCLNFFPAASEIYFFDGESTKIRLLPGLLDVWNTYSNFADVTTKPNRHQAHY